jgi:hypothetical protein
MLSSVGSIQSRQSRFKGTRCRRRVLMMEQLELWPLDPPKPPRPQIWKEVPQETRMAVIAKLSTLVAKAAVPEDSDPERENRNEH